MGVIISQLTEVTSLNPTDSFAIQGTGDTTRVEYQTLEKSIRDSYIQGIRYRIVTNTTAIDEIDWNSSNYVINGSGITFTVRFPYHYSTVGETDDRLGLKVQILPKYAFTLVYKPANGGSDISEAIAANQVVSLVWNGLGWIKVANIAVTGTYADASATRFSYTMLGDGG